MSDPNDKGSRGFPGGLRMFLAALALALGTATVEGQPGVSVDLGAENVESGLRHVTVADGETAAAEVDGLDCRRNLDPTTTPADNYFYFDVDDDFAFEGSRSDLYISIHFHDSGDGSLELQYDSDTGDDLSAIYKSGGSVELQSAAAAETWRHVTYHVSDAYFGNRQNNGADFRIHKRGGGFFHLDLVYVRDFNGGLPRTRMVPPPGRSGPLASQFDGHQFRALFEEPAAWSTTRSMIDVLGYYDHIVNLFSDAELGSWLPQIGVWGLDFFLETGAVNEWCPTGQQCFDAQRARWDRFIGLGASIDGLVMDEPLFKVFHFGLGSFDYAVRETAAWIALVRANYPGVEIGSIEPYPSVPRVTLQNWITELNDELARRGVSGIDFFALDVDWRRFPADGNWNEVQRLEAFCRERGMPFSLICWAAVANISLSDSAWYNNLLLQGRSYAAVGGRPDEYDVQSWLYIPKVAVPETAEYTFTRSTLDFLTEFVEPFRTCCNLAPGGVVWATGGKLAVHSPPENPLPGVQVALEPVPDGDFPVGRRRVVSGTGHRVRVHGVHDVLELRITVSGLEDLLAAGEVSVMACGTSCLPVAAEFEPESDRVTVTLGAADRYVVVVEETVTFLRGDCNGDGIVTGSPSDAVYLLEYCLLGARPAVPCAAACDANADGTICGSVSDMAYVLNYNFRGGPSPPAPFPDCGVGEASDTALGCPSPPAVCSP